MRIAATALVLTLALSPVALASMKKREPTPAQKAQQEKMTACNKEAGDKALKGDERKKFMSTCLKA